jgi:ribosomal protein S18 acetylase RimI-like enzyme
MEDCLTDSSVKVFVIEYQGRKTGMMVLNLSEADAEIIGIAVSANARRKGIGKQMIQRVMESENLESVKAQTDDDSIGFYRKCGFSEERIVIEYPDGSVVRYNCILNK